MARLVDLKITPKSGKFDLDPLHKDVDDVGIYCRKFELSGVAATDSKSGSPKGTREYAGVTIEKRLDAASPSIFQLFIGHVGIKAEFRIYKVNSNTEETPGQVALTVSIGGDESLAWISSYKLIVPDVETAAKDDPDEPYEVITFSFSKIQYHKSGTNHKGAAAEIVVTDSLVGVT